MPSKRYPRDGGVRDAARNGSSGRPHAIRAEKPRFATYPLFGRIPLVRRSRVAADGSTVEWWEWDLDFEQPLPRGAVRGNIPRQNFCPAHPDPRYFYVDEPRTCVQCGAARLSRSERRSRCDLRLLVSFVPGMSRRGVGCPWLRQVASHAEDGANERHPASPPSATSCRAIEAAGGAFQVAPKVLRR
jgi:hypothetical protein